MNRAIAGFVLVVACSRAPRAAAKAIDTPAAPHASSAPESTLVVTGPTFISSVPVTQGEVDSSGDLSEAVSDYQYYLSLAVPVLEKAGVRVQLSNDSTVRWRDQLGSHALSAADSGGILYLFVLPNGRIRTLRGGVQVNDAILAAAREHFGLQIPEPSVDSSRP